MSHVIASTVHHDCEVCGRTIAIGGQHTRVDASNVQHFFHAEHCPDPRCQIGTPQGEG